MITFGLPRPGIRLFNTKRILFFLFLFLLVFPKGGFKLGGVPVTWGYVLVATVTLFILFKPEYSQDHRRIQAYLLTLPFQFLLLLTLLINGFINFGQLAAILIPFIFLPFFFFLCTSKYIERLDLNYFFKLFKTCLFIVAVFGLFLFCVKTFTGKFLKIPLLTTNLHDLGDMEDKHNRRGLLFKLISTYNNGNIYGACILMLLPLYCVVEPSKWRHWIIKISIFLTLSRTSWIGLIFNEFVLNWFIDKKNEFYPIKMAFKIGMAISALCIIGVLIGLGSGLFLDTSLGGRDAMIITAAQASFFSHLPIAAISEMVYLSIAAQFGYVGLLLFLLNMFSPLIIGLSIRAQGPDRRIKAGIVNGLLNYLFICLSDGAMIFIPTMVFYWFLSSFLLRRSFHTETT